MDMNHFDSSGLVQQIGRALTKAILDRSLHGGERLVETEWQKHFGVSRTPLREAFRDLEKKGLVEIRPRRGTFVKKITRKDINEHYPVLAALEGLAARQAYERMNNDQLNDLSGHLRSMQEATNAGNVELFQEHHDQFHRTYITASGNQLLIDMILDLRLRGTMLRFFLTRISPPHCQQRLDVHERILVAFRNHAEGPGHVELLVRSHIEEMLTTETWDT